MVSVGIRHNIIHLDFASLPMMLFRAFFLILSIHFFFGICTPTPYSLALTVPCSFTLVRPSDLVRCRFSFCRFAVARRYSYGQYVLCDGFLHMLVSDTVFVGDSKELS